MTLDTQTTRRLAFEIQGWVPSSLANQRLHPLEWQRLKTETRLCVAEAALASLGIWPKATSGEKRVMVVTQFRTQDHFLDEDNLVASVKLLVDSCRAFHRFKVGNTQQFAPGLALIWDDSPPYLELHVRQVKVARRKEQYTLVEIFA